MADEGGFGYADRSADRSALLFEVDDDDIEDSDIFFRSSSSSPSSGSSQRRQFEVALPFGSPVSQQRRRRRNVLLAVLVVCALAVGIGLGVAIGRHSSGSSNGSSSPNSPSSPSSPSPSAIAAMATSLLQPAKPASPHSPAGATTQLEEALLTQPNASRLASVLKTLTKDPHLAGTLPNDNLATWIRNEWIGYGFEAENVRLVDYYTLLTYPDAVLPNDVEVRLGSKTLFRSTNREAPLTDSERAEAGGADRVVRPFNGYSADGTADGELLYVNFGREEDFVQLAALGVNASGRIVLARYGRNFRGDKAVAAVKFGAKALIIYSDPQQYAVEQDKTYPDGPWLPADGTQRGTLWTGEGDPATPGLPSVPGVWRLPEDEVLALLPTIPVLPIGYGDAQQLLCRLGGPVAPADWQGAIAGLTYHLGPTLVPGTEAQCGAGKGDSGVAPGPGNPLSVHVSVHSNHTVARIVNVIARLPGAAEPDREVILGNHRDAWVTGDDPGSGTVALMELARVLGGLRRSGWRPRRTIVLASWDAEEYGLIGSTEWAEDEAAVLSQRAVAYLNVDMAVTGTDHLAVDAVPSLRRVIERAASLVLSPSGMSVLEEWCKRQPDPAPVVPAEPEAAGCVPAVGALGSGSDFSPFLQHLGVPATDLFYDYKVGGKFQDYPVYHSQHDTSEYILAWVDPTMEYHATLAKVWGLAAAQLAEGLVLPLDLAPYGLTVVALAKDLQQHIVTDKDAPTTLDGSALVAAAQQLRVATQALDAAAATLSTRLTALLGGAASSTDELAAALAQLEAINARIMGFERTFLWAEGLPSRSFFKHVIYAPSEFDTYSGSAFPGVVDSMYAKDYKEAERQLSIATILVERAARFLAL